MKIYFNKFNLLSNRFKIIFNISFNFSHSSDPNYSVKNKFKFAEKEKIAEDEEDLDFKQIASSSIFDKLSVSNNKVQHQHINGKGHLMIKNLYESFKKIEDSDVIIVSYKKDELVVNVKTKGDYRIIIENDTNLLALTSPITGFFKYEYNQVSNFWESIKDQHILDDLLIREFCKHSKGVLEIIN